MSSVPPTYPEASASRRPRSTPAWLIAAALALAWCAYLAMFGPKSRLGDLPRPHLDPPPDSLATFQWDVNDLEGRPIDFTQYRGKPMVLNIWATWCPPCVAEMPSINNLASNGRLKDVPVICVSVDDDRASVRRFVDKHKMTMTVLHANGPPPLAFQTDGIPATFILDAEGRVVVKEVGAAQWDAPEVVDYIENLAKK